MTARIKGLLKYDALKLGRDPLMLLMIIAPLLILVFTRFGVPLIEKLLLIYLSFELHPYKMLIAAFMLLVPSLIIGMAAGFFLLDEKDQNILHYIYITPIGKMRFIIYRTFLPVAVGTLAGILFNYNNGIYVASFPTMLAAVLLASLQTPLYVLFLAALASNKVEGIALGKIAGIFLIAPIASFFLPEPWKYFLGFVPQFWISEIFLNDGEWQKLFILVPVGTLVHGAYIGLFSQTFFKRV